MSCYFNLTSLKSGYRDGWIVEMVEDHSTYSDSDQALEIPSALTESQHPRSVVATIPTLLLQLYKCNHLQSYSSISAIRW